MDFICSASFNVSELSHKKVADSENISENLTYEAVCLHLSLEILEQLLQSPFDVPSPEYEAFLRTLDRPFRVAAKYTAARGFEITCSSLSMIENTPVLLLVVGGSMIVIINLSNGQVGAQFACNYSQFFPLAVRALISNSYLLTLNLSNYSHIEFAPSATFPARWTFWSFVPFQSNHKKRKLTSSKDILFQGTPMPIIEIRNLRGS